MISLSEIWLAIEARVVELVHRTDAAGCRVYASGTQTITASTNTALSFDTELYDTGDCWAVGNATKLYAPSDGYYLAGGGFVLASGQVSAGGVRLNCYARLNGTTYVGGGSDVNTINATEAAVSCAGQGMFWMSAGDYVEIMAFNGFGTNKTASAATSTNHLGCYGWLMRVG